MPPFPFVEREAPIAALDTPFLRDLVELQKQHRTTKQLSNHLAQAAEQLTIAADTLNGRSTNYRVDVGRKRRRAEQNGEELDPEKQKDYEAFQQQVDELTKRLDHGVRHVVDDQAWLDSLPSAMKDISDRAAESNLEARQHLNRQATARENGETPAGQIPDEIDYLPPPRPDEVPTSLLKKARQDHKTAWAAQSLTARYSENNTYVGFYRMVHDAKQPPDPAGEDENGETRAGAAPLPHHSIWFANEEDVNPSHAASGPQSRGNPSQTQRGRSRNPGSGPGLGLDPTQQDPNQSSESEMEIAGETISLRCPITLLPFVDPITSTKCPHSFSREAFDSLFASSADRVLTPEMHAEIAAQTTNAKRAARARELKRTAPLTLGCPVCNEKLERGDVQPDRVLRRRVERVQERERREREREMMEDDDDDDDDDEEEEEEDRITKSQRRAGARVGTGAGAGRGVNIKKEKVQMAAKTPQAPQAAQAPQAQRSGGGRALSRVPDTQFDGAGDEDEDEAEDEGDEEMEDEEDEGEGTDEYGSASPTPE